MLYYILGILTSRSDVGLIKSMTGYGRYEGIVEDKKILAEIRSVNHRFADYNIKTPRNYGFLEEKIRKFLSGKINRGKVDVYVSVESFEQADKDVILNEPLAESYINALKELRDKFSLKDDISVSSVARWSEIFNMQRKDEDSEKIWACVKVALESAADDFVSMREREGERLYKDLVEKRNNMYKMEQQIAQCAPERLEAYRNRLYEKLKEVLNDTNIDESRILTEAAIFADKVAIDEETVRLESHFEEFDKIINAPEPAGRKLDFLIQEINREINTIGSKANDLEISKTVVAFKAELEKMREQVQNVE